MRKLMLVTLGLVAAIAALPLTAQPMGRGFLFRPCLRQAGVVLSPAQRDKLRVLHDEIRLEMDKLRPQFRTMRADLLKAMADPAVPDAKVKALFKQNQKKRQELMGKLHEKFIQVRHILTPEQLRKLSATPACLEPGHGRRGPGKGFKRGRRGHGQGRGMGPNR